MVVVDEGGRFAVPILSGHLGGANDLAVELAALLGGQAVLTTATDVNGIFAVDQWARRQGLFVHNPEQIVDISAALLAGKQVFLWSRWPISGKMPAGLVWAERERADVVVDFGPVPPAAGGPRPLHLCPRTLRLGMGCRKGAALEAIRALALAVLEQAGGPLQAVEAVCTIDLKRDEPGLLAFCGALGLPLITYSAGELAQAEQELCTGDHRNCRLHFTRGVLPARAVDGQTAWERDVFQAQREKNRAYYQARLVENQHILTQLAQRLQNTILLQSDVSDVRTRVGALRPGLAWRAGALQDGRVFSQRRQNELGDLSVDILLDASASQNQQQEKLSTQAYLIAACTVLRIFRDYRETGKNDAIFDYVSAGWNRDGLALRAMGWLMEREQADHRLLILLSDANPNDDQKIPRDGFLPGGRDYGGKLGVKDAAAEAGVLRKKGLSPVCIFTGSDRELPGAREIYGRDLVRIPAIGWFADAVGKLIQGKIQLL